MKFLTVFFVNLSTFSFAELDIFSKCPDFHPINNIDVETLFGDWFTIEMILHYEGNHKALRPDVCVTLYLNSTQQGSQYNSIDFSIRNHNKTHVFQEFNYALKINGSKRGLWIDNDSRNVQVIMIDGNFTVLTFCEKSQLMSFILSREKEVNMSEAIDDAHYLLERRGLAMDSKIALCQSSTIFPFDALTLITAVYLLTCLQLQSAKRN